MKQRELLEQKITLLSKYIFTDKVSLDKWISNKKTFSVGDTWTCSFDEVRYFETKFTVPKQMENKRLVLELSFGGEGTVYINNELKSGITYYRNPAVSLAENRERVDLTDCAKTEQTFSITVQTNMNFKSLFKNGFSLDYNNDDNLTLNYKLNFANVYAVDESVEKFFFDVKAVDEEIKYLFDPSPEFLRSVLTSRRFKEIDHSLVLHSRDDGLLSDLYKALEDALNEIPFYSSDEEIRKSIKNADKVLWKEINQIKTGKEGTVISTGFGHIDVVWLWQEKHTARKVCTTFANALALIDRYSDFVFTFSQPYLFEMLEKNNPELFGKVLQKVKEGRIIPVGNLWIEMDTNLVSGESIVRQLLYGREYYKEKFNLTSDVMFLPDSFGFSASLPQIMKKSGIKYFYTAKLSLNETLRFPHTFFMWEGIDGSEVPSYLQRLSYNGNMNPGRIEELYRRIENKNLSKTAFTTFGYGDGGGGADYKMVESVHRVAKLPGLPNVKMGSIDEFFKETMDNTVSLPTWSDEIYLDKHRGTLTTHAEMKKSNRRAEYLMHNLEIALCLREILLGIPYPKTQIETLWKMILHLQFHDSLPGTAIPQAYKDAQKEYKLFFKEAGDLLDKAVSDLSSHVDHSGELKWNFLSWNRNCVPSLGWSTEQESYQKITVMGNTVENRFFKVSVDKNGLLKSVIDKKTGRNIFKSPSNLLEGYEEICKPNMSAWDINEEALTKSVKIISLDSIKFISEKDCVIIRTERSWRSSKIKQDYVIYSDIQRIDIRTTVDWHENMRMLKAAFFPDLHTDYATYETQFGAIRRPTHKNTDYDAMRFECCGHNWVDLSENNYGLSLLNDCKYGFDIHDDVLRITLLRSSMEPDSLADRGINEFVYSIYPHENQWFAAGTVKAAHELNCGLLKSKTPAAKKVLPSSGSFATVSSDNVIIDSIKKAQDSNGYIMRIYESCGCTSEPTISFMKAPCKITECNLMEENEKQIKYKGNCFKFLIHPYQIRSFRIEFVQNNSK